MFNGTINCPKRNTQKLVFFSRFLILSSQFNLNNFGIGPIVRTQYPSDLDSSTEPDLALMSRLFLVLKRIDWPGTCKPFKLYGTTTWLQIILLWLRFCFVYFSTTSTNNSSTPVLTSSHLVAREGPFLRPKETVTGLLDATCSLDSPS